MTAEQLQGSAELEAARDQRSELRATLTRFEKAIAAAVPGRALDWAAHAHDALVDVAAAFERHIAVTEGPEGLFDAVLRTSPRMANAVRTLGDEHVRIRDELADLLVTVRAVARSGDPAEALRVRERAVDVLAALSRHRQSGADLVYEAYAVDLGAGD
jgi:hypothetical protein